MLYHRRGEEGWPSCLDGACFDWEWSPPSPSAFISTLTCRFEPLAKGRRVRCCRRLTPVACQHCGHCARMLSLWLLLLMSVRGVDECALLECSPPPCPLWCGTYHVEGIHTCRLSGSANARGVRPRCGVDRDAVSGVRAWRRRTHVARHPVPLHRRETAGTRGVPP